MDLEEAYDKIYKNGLWNVLQLYGVDADCLKLWKVSMIVEHV